MESIIKGHFGDYKCPFAAYMKSCGFDHEEGDIIVFPQAAEKQIMEYLGFLTISEYVKFSEWIENGYIIRNPLNTYQANLPTLKTIR